MPTDATIAIVAAVGWTGQNSLIDTAHFGTVQEGRNDFTLIDRAFWDGTDAIVEALYLTASDANWPGSGNHTFSIRQISYGEGKAGGLFFYKNVDQSNPIISTETLDYSNGTQFTTNLSPGTGDMACLAEYRFGAVSNQNGDGDLRLATAEFNDVSFALYDAVGANITGSTDVNSVVAFTLREFIPPPTIILGAVAL